MRATFTLSILFLMLFTSLIVRAQDITRPQPAVYDKGAVIINGARLSKPNQIGPMLLENHRPEVELYFRKYKGNRGASNVFGFIGGFLAGYSLGEAITGKKLNGGLLGSGLGVIGLSALFQIGANSNLKKAVEHYNGNTKGVSLSPGVYADPISTGIGLRLSY
jgi:hypothetical protein